MQGLASRTGILTTTMKTPPGQQQAVLNAFVSWPSDFTTDLVKKSLSAIRGFDLHYHDSSESLLSAIDHKELQDAGTLIVQWCTYDEMLHELTQKYPIEVPNPIIASAVRWLIYERLSLSLSRPMPAHRFYPPPT